MILIADSGATKTDWCIGQSPTSIRTVQTEGITPVYQDTEEIGKILATSLLPRMGNDKHPTHIHFYGAGCTPGRKHTVAAALQRQFPGSRIEVETDLLGAARALCGTTAGIACILGTGSNSCHYDGQQITAHIPPLGYVLGDEGSGATLGKRLVADCLKQQLPPCVAQAFLDEYHLTADTIIDQVYRRPLPNRFLASLAPFLSAHRTVPEIHTLLVSAFTDFFRRNVMHYDYPSCRVHFTGSVAWHFRPEVEEAARPLGIATGRFMQSPLKGLAEYHLRTPI